MTEKKAAPAKRSARKTVNAANLEALGPERLAAILMETAGDHPAVKRRLKLELAGEVGAEALAGEIAKRLEVIEQSRARVNWRRYRDFVRDLQMHRQAAAGRLAELDPRAALELIIRFVALHPGVSDRVSDAKGEIESEFETAVTDAAEIVRGVRLIDARPLADQLFDGLERGTPGLTLPLLLGLAPALPDPVVALLRQRVEAAMAERRRPNHTLRSAAQMLADAQGDVDGYIAYVSPSQAVLPPVGARIARRLLDAGRIDEARAALDRSSPGSPSGSGSEDDGGWHDMRIALLEAEGDAAGAQAARWTRFETTLSPATLREHLKRLDDFDDVVAEDRAMEHVRGHRDLSAALSFFLAWPALDLAAELVLERREQLGGRDPELLAAAAKVLEGRHPLAAVLLLRAAIWDTARYARVERYKDAQRQLLEAESLSVALDAPDLESHAAFAARVAVLRRW